MIADCRTLWPLLYNAASRACVEVAERFADGLATQQELHEVQLPGEVPTSGYDFEPRTWRISGTQVPNFPPASAATVELGVFAERDLEDDDFEVDPAVKARLMAAADLAYFTCREHPFQSGDYFASNIDHVDWPGDWLIRCIFGKPFLPPVTLDPSWQTRRRRQPCA